MTTINHHDHFFCFTEKDMDCNMPCYFACSIGHYPGNYFQLRWVPSIVLILNANFMQAIQVKGVCYSQMCYSLWLFKINNVSFFFFSFFLQCFPFIRLFFPTKSVLQTTWPCIHMTIIGIPTLAKHALILKSLFVVLAALTYKGLDLDFLKMCQ